MRLLLVGGFAYPHDQGSQIYFQEQALALSAAGAEIEVLSYGPGRAGTSPHPLAGLPFHAIPAWAAPASRRSGPQAAKLLADLGLALALRRRIAAATGRGGSHGGETGAHPGASELASKKASGSASSKPSPGASFASWRVDVPNASAARPSLASKATGFDAILAHHAEAALLARYALAGLDRPPVVYCAHTLLEQELPEYFKSSRSGSFSTPLEASAGTRSAPGPVRCASEAGGTPAQPEDLASRPIRAMTQRVVACFGRVIDRRIAAGCDGWIALTQSAARVMAASGNAPGRLIAPPVPATDDAERGRLAAPSAARDSRRDAAAFARGHGLQPGHYFLYSGNLDGYQALPLLEAIARRRCDAGGGEGAREGADTRHAGVPENAAPPRPRLPIVIATHDERASAFAARIGRAGLRGLVVCRVRSADEAAALLAGARASIVPRRSLGGFPIKLANSLAAGVPVVALHGAEWGLVDGREALLGDPADPVDSLARALDRLELDPALAARLGEGARATHRRQHDPARVAAETLALVAALAEGARQRS